MRKVDTRKFPRLPLDIALQYQILEPPSPLYPQSRVKNISAGGLCIVMLEKVETNTLLKLEFSLPGENKPIAAKGKVVWIEKLTIISAETHTAFDCGVEFVDISLQDIENINRHTMFK